ncbi:MULTISPECIES: MBL fold metallo-hydrolase [unclassified Acinetobacter]|uniref:MBL fold metallo-hydrolase n=1 Tax=unclassified Acinetobacter TaxID=196816 RepID=UPI0035B7F738
MLQCQIVPVSPFVQNCSIIWDDASKDAVIIDAGGDADKIRQAVSQLGVNVKAIWLTHGHIDHISAVGDMVESYAVPVIGPHKGDAFWIDGLADVCKKYGFPIAKPVTVTQWLNHGDSLSLGEYDFEVRHVPGHSAGHVIFYCAKVNTAWVGDTIFQGSIGRTDLPTGDLDTLLNAIREQLFSLPDNTQCISGHGNPTTIGQEKRFNPFLKA